MVTSIKFKKATALMTDLATHVETKELFEHLYNYSIRFPYDKEKRLKLFNDTRKL